METLEKEKIKGKRLVTAFSIDPILHEKFKQVSAKENMSMSKMIERFMLQKVRESVDPEAQITEYLVGKAARM
ncbi:hypothetical protein NIES25_52390 [Nostoc linckia NIES-25]|nr:hypothetical protein NIES25_52390 [Nostoc linckia NIES-25]